MTDGNRNIWYLAVVLALFVALPASLNALPAGVTAVVATVSSTVPAAVAAVTGMEMCDEVCDQGASCDTECFEPIFLHASSTTCGEWDGGIYNLHCEGECGDDLCAEWAGEGCSSCSDDCGPCPDEPTCGQDGCELGETCRNCALDCACPDPEQPDDGTCGTGESYNTYDCQTPSEFCNTAQDCPDFGTVGAKCVENQCVVDDYDAWAPACNPLVPPFTGQCPSGWYCGRRAGINEWVCVDPLANR